MCDGHTSKEMSVGAGGPRETMSVGTISRDLKDLEAEGSCRHLKAFLKVFFVQGGEFLSRCFPLTLWRLAVGEGTEVGWFTWLMDDVGNLEVGINSSGQGWEVADWSGWEGP